MANETLDTSPTIMLANPNVDTVKRARRWLRGAAMLLADASNGDPIVERLACEASTLATVTEIALYELEGRNA